MENDPRAAVWMAVARRCRESNSQFSAAFVDALAQAAVLVAENLGRDVESFARHARRAKVSVEDVRLCARHNQDVLAQLDD
ncbi:hypothetical protein EV183_001300 [Coemansia sp. RSA 2336]|nr:hypothetical protein EV183_001300 [Coemansia sp. RSA 2336]